MPSRKNSLWCHYSQVIDLLLGNKIALELRQLLLPKKKCLPDDTFLVTYHFCGITQYSPWRDGRVVEGAALEMLFILTG